MRIGDKTKLNFRPIDLNIRSQIGYGFKVDDKPTVNSNFLPSFRGLLAEKNFADLIQNDEIRNKDASYIIGGRLFDAVVDINGSGDYTSVTDALNSGEKRIFVRAGVYIISDTIQLLDDNIVIIGESMANTIFKISLNKINFEVFTVGNSAAKVSNIIINNIQIDGNSKTGYGNTGIMLANCSDVQIISCRFYNILYYGISASSTYDSNIYAERVLISSCRFDSMRRGVYCLATTATSEITRWWINNNSMSIDELSYESIRIEGIYVKKINIINNHFKNNGASISLYSTSQHIISENTITTTGDEGIYGTFVSYNIISNNYIENADRRGIKLEFSCSHNIIINNIIFDCSDYYDGYSASIYVYGTSAEKCNRNVITGNNVRNSNINIRPGYIVQLGYGNYNLVSNNIGYGMKDGAVDIGFNGANTVIANNIAELI